MRRSRVLIIAPLGLLLAALACQAPLGGGTVAPAEVETALAETLSAGASATAESGAAPSATPEAAGGDTATPSATATITATPPPFAELTEDTNCRTGPLRVYDLITTILQGQRAEILGKNAQETYWYVTDPDAPGRSCWMWGRYAQVMGDTSAIPVFTPPPTPTPAYDWTGSWTVWLSGDYDQGSMTLEQSGRSIAGTLTGEGDTFRIFGTASDDGRTASGEISSDLSSEVTFSWRMLDNSQQFMGSLTIHDPGSPEAPQPYCGAREGQPMPEPCLWP